MTAILTPDQVAEIHNRHTYQWTTGCGNVRALADSHELLRGEVERLTREREEALRGFGFLDNEPAGLKRYAEVFAREIRECPKDTQGDNAKPCVCVSVIMAHVRRMLAERQDAMRERDTLRARLATLEAVRRAAEKLTEERDWSVEDVRAAKIALYAALAACPVLDKDSGNDTDKDK